MAILSISSHVACGHVGNSASVFALQCLGFEVWPVHTTLYSDHPGHGPRRGAAVAPDVVADILAGIADRHGPGRIEAVLSGYLAATATAAAALTAVAAAKASSASALYCCDPVLGDAREGVYVDAALARWIGEHAIAAADIVTPNGFELAYLAGRPAGSEAEAVAAARTLLARGPRLVVATSVPAAGDDGRIATLAVTANAAWRVATPVLPTRAKGAGDVLAALFLGRYLSGGDVAAALGDAVSSVFGLLSALGKETGGADALDLPLVAARAEITGPCTRFYAEPVRHG